jgi:hypothetical protein
MGGGPLANMLARAGLKRSASLPPPTCSRWSFPGALVSLVRLGNARDVAGDSVLSGSVETRFSNWGEGLFAGGSGDTSGFGDEAVPLAIRLGPGVGFGELAAGFGGTGVLD